MDPDDKLSSAVTLEACLHGDSNYYHIYYYRANKLLSTFTRIKHW